MNTTEKRIAELLEARREYYRNPALCRVCKGVITFQQFQKAKRDDVFCGKPCQMAWLGRLNADRVRPGHVSEARVAEIRKGLEDIEI